MLANTVRKTTLIEKYDATIRKSANHCFSPEKPHKFFKEQIRKAFLKKCRKLFLKRLIENVNVLLVIEDLSTTRGRGRNTQVDLIPKLHEKLYQHNTKSSIILTHTYLFT